MLKKKWMIIRKWIEQKTKEELKEYKSLVGQKPQKRGVTSTEE